MAKTSIPASRAAVRPFANDLALWAHAARLAPQLPLVRYHHGQFLEEAGRHAPGDVDEPGSVAELRASLPTSGGTDPVELDDDTLEKLRSLGYLADPAPGAAPRPEAPPEPPPISP